MKTENSAKLSRRRSGTTIVETAVVISLFLMFLFGILEYSRYLLMLHVTTNAARDAARYATVRISFPQDFDYRDAQIGESTVPSVWKYAQARMGGVDRMLTDFHVITFPCDNNELYGVAPDYKPRIVPKPGYVAPTLQDYLNGSNVARLVSWNNASFTERIAVEISGTYQPVLPNFLFMNGIGPTRIFAVMGSEG